jgi:hypothetical protein
MMNFQEFGNWRLAQLLLESAGAEVAYLGQQAEAAGRAFEGFAAAWDAMWDAMSEAEKEEFRRLDASP